MADSKDLNPGKILTIAGSYLQTYTLHTAIKFNVFTA